MRALFGLADAVRWPFERAAWALERRVIWPMRRRLAGWRPSPLYAGGAALAAVAVAAALVGVSLLGGGSGGQAAQRARVAVATPAPQPQPQPSPAGPVLHGAAPQFSAGKDGGTPRSTGDEAGASEADIPIAKATGSDEAPAPEEGAAATSSSAEPVAAGPAAMKIARRFSEAFVYYEIGQRPARAKAVFGETATPRLAGTLAKRPPRLPANSEIPKARVVNLVPGPRRGRAYTVSVSLLRVGLTSELRLTLEPGKEGDWRVAEILG